MWILFQILACLFIFAALMYIRIVGFTFQSYAVYVFCQVALIGWMMPKSYELAPTFLQPWFLGLAVLALCGFAGMLLLGESVKLLHLVGTGLVLVGSYLLVR